MKRLILNTLLLASFLIALLAISINTSSACRIGNGQLIALADDPNQPWPGPQPEITINSGQLTYLEQDPNDPWPGPQPETVPYDLKLTYLADDPNEPRPEPQPE
jgi:hypothetical protein